jgi:hypothetical protein
VLILAALAAGALVDGAAPGSSAVVDAYAGLKARLVDKLNDRLDGVPDAGRVLAGYAEAPGAWRGRLASALVQSGAGAGRANR